MTDKRYSVIAPAYNEEGNVGPLVERITQAMAGHEPYEIIIVDDGSTDATLARLKELMATHKTLAVIALTRNSGQTIAYQAAFDHARGERIITMDSDLEKDPAYIPKMIEKLEDENLDLVYFRKRYQDVSFMRKLGSGAANKFRRAVTGDKAMDVGSTFVLYRRNFLKGRNLLSGFHRYFIGFMEAEGKTMGYVEGPVFNRPTGETKYTTWGRLKQGLMDMFYYYLYKNKTIGAHRFLFGVAALAIAAAWLPLGAGWKAAVFTLFAAVVALTVSLSLHAVHLLVRQRRPAYAIREILRPDGPDPSGS